MSRIHALLTITGRLGAALAGTTLVVSGCSIGGSVQVSPSPSPQVFDLASTLPKSVDGVALTAKTEMGDSYLNKEAAGDVMRTFLFANGKSPADLEVTTATDTAQSLGISAFAVAGADPTWLEHIVVDTTLMGAVGTRLGSPATVAGKQVVQLGAPFDRLTYFFVDGGVVFAVQTAVHGADQTLAAHAVAATPAAPVPAIPPPPSVPVAPALTAAELSAMVPRQVDKVAFTIQDASIGSGEDEILDDFLMSVGKTRHDVVRVKVSPTSGTPNMAIFVWDLAGVDPRQLMTEIAADTILGTTTGSADGYPLWGRQMIAIIPPGQFGIDMYADGGVVYEIQSGDPVFEKDLVATLPCPGGTPC